PRRPRHTPSQKLERARHRIGAVREEGHELLARNEQQVAGIACHGRRGAPFAVEQGDLAEELAGPEDVQDQSLAIYRIHGESDAARQDAVEAVAGVALLEEDVSRRDARAARTLGQLLRILRRQRSEEGMEAEQVLGRPSSSTVEPWSAGSLAYLRSPAQAGANPVTCSQPLRGLAGRARHPSSGRTRREAARRSRAPRAAGGSNRCCP